MNQHGLVNPPHVCGEPPCATRGAGGEHRPGPCARVTWNCWEAHIILNFENMRGNSEEGDGTSIPRRSNLGFRGEESFSVEPHRADMNHETGLIRLKGREGGRYFKGEGL